MPLSKNQKAEISSLLSKKIHSKLQKYGRETSSMPFLARLVQDNEKIAAYSFIHSLSTTLGMSIYEEVSRIIASEHSQECFRNYGIGGAISKQQKTSINQIINQLRNGERKANIKKEIAEIIKANPAKGQFQKSGNIADFYMLRDGEEHYFEIKTVALSKKTVR